MPDDWKSLDGLKAVLKCMVAIVTMIVGLLLKLEGADGVVGAIMIAVSAAYFGLPYIESKRTEKK